MLFHSTAPASGFFDDAGDYDLPVIISTTEEALRQVPNSFRVVSTSLGGTRWQTIWRIPAASYAGDHR